MKTFRFSSIHCRPFASDSSAVDDDVAAAAGLVYCRSHDGNEEFLVVDVVVVVSKFGFCSRSRQS